MEPLIVLVIVLLLIQLILIGLFVWLLADVRREGRLREQRDYERQLQLIGVNQTLANQLPQIVSGLQDLQREVKGLARA